MGFFSRKAAKAEKKKEAVQAIDDRGWSRIFDWIPGAWQQHTPYDTADSVVSYPPVFSCISLISGDVCKLVPTIQKLQSGVWKNVDHPALQILLKPNKFQNHMQFKQWWISCKLIWGNTYALKVRKGRKVVALILLEPTAVTPLVSTSGEVYYRLGSDNLAQLLDHELVVPASEIIHDRDNCLYHPLIGLPPLYACTVSGSLGLKMQSNLDSFFANGSSPGGILTAPGSIDDENAARLKKYWQENFTGKNAGNIAVAGDGLKYEPMRMTNVDAQLLEILRWTAETVCSVYHVPAYMAGVGALPSYNNIEALTQQYYGQCLQKHIESMELSLQDGLEIESGYRVQLDLDGLFRMDTATLTDTLGKGVGAGIMSPDEGRKRLNLPPVPGGKYPYLQQQNYSLEALSQRDATNPLAVPAPAPASVEPEMEEEEEVEEDGGEEAMKIFCLVLEKELHFEIAAN